MFTLAIYANGMTLDRYAEIGRRDLLTLSPEPQFYNAQQLRELALMRDEGGQGLGEGGMYEDEFGSLEQT